MHSRPMHTHTHSSHIQDLKDITHDDLYETYRTQKLSMGEQSER